MTESIAPIDYAMLEESVIGGATARRGQTVMARGQGSWLYDIDGNRYLDMTSSQGVAMLGHAHPVLTAAIAEQAGQLISCPNFFYNETRARFAAKLVEVLPDYLPHVFLANSGAEVIDGAIKFAAFDHRPTGHRCGHARLSRAHHRRALVDLGTQVSQAFYAVARRRSCALQQSATTG